MLLLFGCANARALSASLRCAVACSAALRYGARCSAVLRVVCRLRANVPSDPGVPCALLGSGIINVSLVIPMITRQYQVSNSHRSVPGSTMLRGPAGPALAVDRNPFHLNPGATLAWGNRRLHSLLLAEPLSLPCPGNHYRFRGVGHRVSRKPLWFLVLGEVSLTSGLGTVG